MKVFIKKDIGITKRGKDKTSLFLRFIQDDRKTKTP